MQFDDEPRLTVYCGGRSRSGEEGSPLFYFNRRALVLALNERTYLTLVFPLAPRTAFRARFATALTWALSDLGVAQSAIEPEAMALDFLPLARLSDRSIASSLNDLEFFGRCELDDTDDLRRVQFNLNEVPHVKRDPCCAADAVAELFDRVDAGRTRHRSH